MKLEASKIIDKSFKKCCELLLPTDAECEAWHDLNIDGDSASSAIYKFRLWLNDRAKQLNK